MSQTAKLNIQLSPLTERYLNVRHHSAAICEPLQTEDYVVQPVVDVSPPKWHLAHTTWFWEAFVLTQYVPDYTPFHPRYSFLFNSYYNAKGDRVLRLHRGNMSRPTVKEIMDYRAYVDEHMVTILDNPEIRGLVEIGIHHEQQHQELLYTDIKYIFGHNPLFPAYQDDFEETPQQAHDHNSFATVPEGNYSIGFTGDDFSFDNEHAYTV